MPKYTLSNVVINPVDSIIANLKGTLKTELIKHKDIVLQL